MRKLRTAPIGFALVATLVFSLPVAAATVVVTPTNTQGWSTADTRPGGAVTFVADATAPGGAGALRLTTDATTAAKAQFLHEANAPLASVTELGFWAKQTSGPPHADPSYQFLVDLNGDAMGGFTTFVAEPYQNGVVIPGVWQQWDVDAGTFWSSRSFAEGTCVVVAGSGGPPFYTLAGLQAACPDAVAIGFGVNVGTFNPSYDVLADLVSFNGTTYDFELHSVPTDKDECKDDGWQTFNPPTGPFMNQGDCVSYVATGGNNP